MKLIYWLIAGPLMVLAALFATSNRGSIELGLWPLPFTVQAPIYLVALCSLAVGFLAGGTVAWFGGARARARARAAERAVRRRDAEIEDLRRKAGAAEREVAVAQAQASRAVAPKLPAPADTSPG